MQNNNIDIKYLNKSFGSFKADLIEYAKSYYPTNYKDFNQASPGTMFIEMAAYVGDVNGMLATARPSSDISMVQINEVPDFSDLMSKLKAKGAI